MNQNNLMIKKSIIVTDINKSEDKYTEADKSEQHDEFKIGNYDLCGHSKFGIFCTCDICTKSYVHLHSCLRQSIDFWDQTKDKCKYCNALWHRWKYNGEISRTSLLNLMVN